jgi:hypothetical protein
MNKNPLDIGVEIDISKPENFLLIKESLTRIGIASRNSKTLYQTAHILHKRGKYFICHFKELFALDNKESILDDTDLSRRNLICSLLEQWGLLTILDLDKMSPIAAISAVRVLSFKDKNEWTLQPKYQLGQVRNAERNYNC